VEAVLRFFPASTFTALTGRTKIVTMKQLIIALLILLFNNFYAQGASRLTLHFSGAQVGDSVLVSYPENEFNVNNEEYLLTLDTTLSATLLLQLRAPRELTIRNSEAEFIIYMKPDENLDAQLNWLNPLRGSVFSGYAASAAVLFANYQYQFGDFGKQAEQNITDCLLLAPQDYLKKQDSLLEAQIHYLKTRKETVSEDVFNQLQDRAVYTTLMNKLRYPMLRCYLTRKAYSTLLIELIEVEYFYFADSYKQPIQLPKLSLPVTLAFYELNRYYYLKQRGDSAYSTIGELQCVEKNFKGDVCELLLAYTLSMQFATGLVSEPAYSFVNNRIERESYKIILRAHYEKLSLLQPGKPAPGLELMQFNGKPFSLDSLRGKTVLIEFWHSGCAPCLDGFAAANELHSRLPNNVEMLYVCADQDSSQGGKVLRKFQVKGIHVHAPGFKHQALVAYQIQSFPSLILIAPDGTIISANAPRPGSKELDELLNPK
jgi:thiol-disulfide isomerase/thioredoxin